MSAPTLALPEPAVEAPETASAPLPRTRPLYWSLRRELWENRSLYLAPLCVGVSAVVALVIHAGTMPSHVPGLLAKDPATAGSASVTYRVAAVLMLVTAFITGAFYCLEALSSERRDRSILFWRSLPVSDRATVLAKAAAALLVLPAVTLGVIVAVQLTLLLLSTVTLLVQGYSAAPLWSELQLLRLWPAMLYSVAVMTLWHAPLYGFLLLVSGWARRTAALWAVLPLLAIGVLEKLTMDTTHLAALLRSRLIGWYPLAFAAPAREAVVFHPATPLTPGRLLATPDLWIGLVLAAVFIAASVRLRRSREPI